MNAVEKIAQVAYEAGVNKALNELGFGKEAGLLESAAERGMRYMRQAGRPTSFFEGLGASLEAGRQAGALTGTAAGGLVGAKSGLNLARELAPDSAALALALAAPTALTGAVGGNLVGRALGMGGAVMPGTLLNLPVIRHARNLATRPII
jgi:hypothetical protein